MLLFYLISLIPIIIGAVLWVFGKKIVLWEYLISAASALLLAVIFQFISIWGMTADEEMWSGQIMSERQFSRWQEYYEYAVYRTEVDTDSKGNVTTRQVFDHWEPTSRWHDEHWTAYSNINTEYEIEHPHFLHLEKQFKHSYSVRGDRTTWEHNSRMIGGDPLDYISENKSGFIEPVVEIKSFENKVKAAPSVFSFVKVPESIPVFNWPRPENPFGSQRVLGTATNYISQRKWDELNAILGPKYRVNLIIIGFNNSDSSILQYQEAKFVGGRKNDLIITFTEQDKKIQNVKVFGWTESENCKRNIESFILDNGVNESLLTYLPNEIKTNYKLKDWKKFDFITVEPAASYYYWFFGILTFVQSVLYFFFHTNLVTKDSRTFGKFKEIMHY